MAAAPPQIDPASELAALRARATALGATADTPGACLSEFVTFSGKALPTLEGATLLWDDLEILR